MEGEKKNNQSIAQKRSSALKQSSSKKPGTSLRDRFAQPMAQSKESMIPIGLIIFMEWLESHPQYKKDMLEYEIARRESEHLILKETKKVLSWHPWSTFRLLLITGGLAFSVAWSLSAISDTVQIYNQFLGKGPSGLPSQFTDSFVTLTNLLPKINGDFFAGIPDYGAIESLYIALGVIGIIVIIKLTIILFNWKKIQALVNHENQLHKELHFLEEQLETEKG